MANVDPHRECWCRQHRVFGNYLAVEAWSRGLDCIVLQRVDLESFLGLKRFKSIRVKWLQSDLKPWFRYQEAFYKAKSPSSIHSLFPSRLPLKGCLSTDSMTTDKRIELMDDDYDAPRTELFSKEGVTVRRTEAEIIAYLSTLAAGLDLPPGNQSAT